MTTSICTIYNVLHGATLEDRIIKHDSNPPSRKKRDWPGLKATMDKLYLTAKIIMNKKYERSHIKLEFDVESVSPMNTCRFECFPDLKARLVSIKSQLDLAQKKTIKRAGLKQYKKKKDINVIAEKEIESDTENGDIKTDDEL